MGSPGDDGDGGPRRNPAAARPRPEKDGPETSPEGVERTLYLMGLRAPAGYRPVAMLGYGAQGVVFRAVQERLGRPVVVKVMRFGPETPAAERVRFEREASLLAAMKSPYVVRVLDHGLDPEAAFLVYPDEGGQALSDLARARGGRLPPEEVRVMVRQALEGLAEAHGQGIVHRDVKPANLLRADDGGVRILDFGLARAQAAGDTVTRTGMVTGSPGYLAPDRFRGADAEPHHDLYALGVVAHELVGGEHPFKGRDLAECLARHESMVPPRLDRLDPTVPYGLARLVEAMLAKSPAARPRDAREALTLLDAWEAEAGGSGRVMAARHDDATVVPPAQAPVPVPAPTPAPGKVPTPVPRPAEGARAEAPRGWHPGARSGLTLGLLLGAAAAAFLPRLFSSGNGPGSPAEAPTPDPAPDSPFEPDYPDRVREELTDAQGRTLRFERGDGRIRAPQVVDPDPILGRARWEELPRARRFLEWIAGGGRPETLPEPVRSELERAGEWYATQGLPSPFFPYLEVRPATAAEATTERVRVFYPKVLPGSRAPAATKGWFGTFLSRMGRLAEVSARDSYAYAESKGLPDEIRRWRWLYPVNAPDLAYAVRWYFRQADGRIAYSGWLREGQQHLAAMLYALGRSLAEEPATAEEAAVMGLHALRAFGGPYHPSHLGTYPPGWLLGPPVPGSRVYDLVALHLRRFERVLLRPDPKAPDLAPEERVLATRVAEPGASQASQAAAPWIDLRVKEARFRLAVHAASTGDATSLRRHLADLSDWLAATRPEDLKQLSQQLEQAGSKE